MFHIKKHFLIPTVAAITLLLASCGADLSVEGENEPVPSNEATFAMTATAAPNETALAATVSPEAADVSAVPETSPSEAEAEGEEVNGDEKLGYYATYDPSGEVSERLSANPIDQDHSKELTEFDNSPEFSTSGWAAIQYKYAAIWQTEMEAAYDRLLEKLEGEIRESLIASQKGWLSFHEKETDFVWSAFASGSEYDFGQMGQMSLSGEKESRVRSRALQLIEYDMMLGGDLKFIYTGQP